MYRNLRAELIRIGMTIKELAFNVGITERSMRNKINGKTEFLWSEVLKISHVVNPNISLEELFKKDAA